MENKNLFSFFRWYQPLENHNAFPLLVHLSLARAIRRATVDGGSPLTYIEHQEMTSLHFEHRSIPSQMSKRGGGWVFLVFWGFVSLLKWKNTFDFSHFNTWNQTLRKSKCRFHSNGGGKTSNLHKIVDSPDIRLQSSKHPWGIGQCFPVWWMSQLMLNL